ncbi:MAG TPA: rod shape-determining protein MreD [Streptosporangiaceae bacterium]|nr:rod shape-determining protein MreD [Streptosporangiaceae bacterium]
MKRALVSAVVLAAALVLQLTVVNRLPLPGAGAPDLVLLAVAALGLCSRPATGAVTGFCAGLCLDLAPPGSYLIGEYALVFCLVGYFCGRLSSAPNRSALLTILAAMGAAVAGEALFALLGLAVSDPQVTWATVRDVLPSAVIYDVVLTPFVLYLIMRVVRFADALGQAPAAAGAADGSALLARTQAAGGGLPRGALAGATVLGGAGLLGGAGWLAGPVGSRGSRARGSGSGARPRGPRTPRLREAAARPGDGWVGGAPRTGLPAAPRLHPGRPGRPPRLRPGAGGSAIARPARTPPRSTPNLRMGAASRRGGNIGRSLGTGGAGAVPRGPRGSGPPGSAFRSRRPGAPGSGARGRPAGPVHSPKFRPDTRLPGGSARAGVPRGGPVPRALPSRRLRLGGRRRHDGVLGGSVLARRGRGRPARAVSMRFGPGRRGDGAVGGLPGGRRLWARPRLGAQRRAAPRFRSGAAAGGRSVLGRRTRLGAGKQARFNPGRSSLLAAWTGGRLGGRSTVWRIGSRRTGGFR